MKKHQQWLTAGLVLGIVGVLVGCSTTGHGTSPTTNVTNRISTTNTISASNNTSKIKSGTSSAVNATTNTVGNNSTQNTRIAYKTYTNQRFGFSVQYPSTWQMGPRPTDGDGRWFTTPSGVKSYDNGYGSGVAKSDVIILAVGTPNVVNGSGNGYNFKQMVASFKKNLSSQREQQGFISENYTIVPNKWIINTVVTNVGHGGIQYSEMYTSLSTNQTITMTIPKSQSNVYLPTWNYVAKKFQPGNKNG